MLVHCTFWKNTFIRQLEGNNSPFNVEVCLESNVSGFIRDIGFQLFILYDKWRQINIRTFDSKPSILATTSTKVYLHEDAPNFHLLVVNNRQLNFAYSYGRDRNNLDFSMLAWHDKKPFQLKQCQGQKKMNTFSFLLKFQVMFNRSSF